MNYKYKFSSLYPRRCVHSYILLVISMILCYTEMYKDKILSFLGTLLCGLSASIAIFRINEEAGTWFFAFYLLGAWISFVCLSVWCGVKHVRG